MNLSIPGISKISTFLFASEGNEVISPSIQVTDTVLSISGIVFNNLPVNGLFL